jgi:two-component system chemotaxis response regulator CheB
MARQAHSKRQGRTRSEQEGKASVFTCPDCQGTLFLLDSNGVIRYRCRVGHIYSPESMLEAQDDNVERLMWSAVRSLFEQAEYVAQMSRQISTHDHKAAHEYAVKSRAAQHKAVLLRRLIIGGTENRKDTR